MKLSLKLCWRIGYPGTFCRVGLKDGLNPYVFPLAIRLTRGDKLTLLPIYLGSLFYRLDLCVQNIIKSTDQHIVVTHADTSFLQLFLCERFKTLGTMYLC